MSEVSQQTAIRPASSITRLHIPPCPPGELFLDRDRHRPACGTKVCLHDEIDYHVLDNSSQSTATTSTGSMCLAHASLHRFNVGPVETAFLFPPSRLCLGYVLGPRDGSTCTISPGRRITGIYMTQALLGSQAGTSVIRTAHSVPILCTDFVECFLPPHVPCVEAVF